MTPVDALWFSTLNATTGKCSDSKIPNVFVSWSIDDTIGFMSGYY